MWRLVDPKPNVAVPWYLVTSWLYYRHDISVIPDDDYNELALRLMESWDTIDHRHKHLITLDDLKAGTGYAITEYPEIVRSAATRIAIEDKHVRWNARAKLWVPKH